MKINITAKTGSKKQEIQRIDEKNYKVYVTELPIDGKANSRIIELLSDYFDVAKSEIVLLKGEKSKNKIFDIP